VLVRIIFLTDFPETVLSECLTRTNFLVDSVTGGRAWANT